MLLKLVKGEYINPANISYMNFYRRQDGKIFFAKIGDETFTLTDSEFKKILEIHNGKESESDESLAGLAKFEGETVQSDGVKHPPLWELGFDYRPACIDCKEHRKIDIHNCKAYQCQHFQDRAVKIEVGGE